MYAELRPTLDAPIPDGENPADTLDFTAQLETIVRCVDTKKQELEQQHKADKFPFDLKVIYCLPRSFGYDGMKKSLDRFTDRLLEWKGIGKEGEPEPDPKPRLLEMICGQ